MVRRNLGEERILPCITIDIRPVIKFPISILPSLDKQFEAAVYNNNTDKSKVIKAFILKKLNKSIKNKT